MSDPIVETKLLRPRPRTGIVDRPRLVRALARGAEAPVTLLSAPAGFGKTTLLASWLAGQRRPIAWVSFDERDRAAGTFWSYLLLAVERAAPDAADAALTGLRSGQASIEAVLATLVNELSVLPGDLTIVLDDYHLVDGPDIQPGVGFLVDHLPPQVHLVISTRADPVLPLARLRARGQLVEIRAADLRFAGEESAALLNDSAGLALTADDITTLEARTEGWAAALQLAALSLRGHRDPAGFIAGFAGDDRFVVDYLADEVLDAQPAAVRRFLLETSILDRLTGPLCDAVTGAADHGDRDAGTAGAAMLQALERQNLFVVPLDDQRRWYRYHHLFGDVLRAHLVGERPDDVALLHRRASRWYADAGMSEEAVAHALAAGDVDTAAGLVELAVPELRRARREDVLRRWIEDLPADVVDRRPVLALGFIGALMASNDLATVPARLAALEELMARPAAESVVVDAAELPRLPGAVETYRAGLALAGGDPRGAIARGKRAIAAAAEGDDLTRSAASGLIGLAHWTRGDIVAAHAAYLDCAAGLTRAGHIADVLGCSLTLADMELALGRLGDAERTLRQALALAEAHTPDGQAPMRGSADMLVALSRAAWHRDDLVAAHDLLRRANSLGESAGLPQNPYRWRVALARLRAAEHDWDAAVTLIDEAERFYVGDYSPPVHPLHATRARLLAASGDLPAALAWAERHRVSADDEPSYLREYEHVTLAAILLARHASTGESAPLATARRLLDRLLAAADAGGRVGSVLEIEVLRARAEDAAGESTAALVALEHALDLAEPDGWVRFLLDAGPGLTDLLAAAARRRTGSGLASALLAARDGRAAVDGTGRTAAAEPAGRGLLDPLSERELEVLRLLGSELDGPGIARELVVSLNTVRTHTKHIYTKLGVNNRRAAVRAGHQLGLLRGAPAG